MKRLAVLSLHTSPLAQPGTGDGGGMNVYVRELSSSLARSGVECDVYTRAWSPDLPAVVNVEPGMRVHHIPAGPLAPVAKEDLFELVGEFATNVGARIDADAIHANYWLSGIAGHIIKHERGLPLVSTFHTLDRMKAEPEDEGDLLGQIHRAQGESQVMGCSDLILASCSVEADQICELYEVDPDRIEVVPPGVDHAFFAPGNRTQARRALGLSTDGTMLLFVGRLQPLKGATVAIEALEHILNSSDAAQAKECFLVIVGGPSGVHGATEQQRIHDMVAAKQLDNHVIFVDPQPHEFLSTFYRAADVCLVPSRSESFGLVALEASACGTPVVASAVGGLLTLVEHGVTGYLVEEREPELFAEYVMRILRDDTVKTAMSVRAAEKSRSYTWRESAESLQGIYTRLTSRELVECG